MGDTFLNHNNINPNIDTLHILHTFGKDNVLLDIETPVLHWFLGRLRFFCWGPLWAQGPEARSAKP